MRPVLVVFLAPPVYRGLRGLDRGERPGLSEEVGLQGLVPPLDLADGGRLTGQSKIILWITSMRQGLAGVLVACAFEAAELFFVAADFGGESFEAAAQLVDLHGQAGQGGGVASAGAVLVDERAQFGTSVEGGAADAGEDGDLAERDGLPGCGELVAGGFDSGQVVVLLVSWHGPG